MCPVASMNIGRSGHDLLVMNGSLVSVGGDENGGTIEAYNLAYDTWTLRKEKLNEDHCGAFLKMKYYL